MQKIRIEECFDSKALTTSPPSVSVIDTWQKMVGYKY
jgi:hypothetical protein